jgi:hypothetical protein
MLREYGKPAVSLASCSTITFTELESTEALAHGIDNHLCGRQPITIFKEVLSSSPNNLLRRLLPIILDKLSPERCRGDYLITYMNATTNTLLSFGDYGTITKPDVYKAQLCNAIAASLSSDDVLAYLLEGPYETLVKVRENMDRADTLGMVAVAATVGNEAVLLYFADKVQSTMTSSELYGTPLLAAAVNGQARAASIIFGRIEWEATKKEAGSTCGAPSQYAWSHSASPCCPLFSPGTTAQTSVR